MVLNDVILLEIREEGFKGCDLTLNGLGFVGLVQGGNVAFYSVRSDRVDVGVWDGGHELSQVDPVSLDGLRVQTLVLPAVDEVRGDE